MPFDPRYDTICELQHSDLWNIASYVTWSQTSLMQFLLVLASNTKNTNYFLTIHKNVLQK